MRICVGLDLSLNHTGLTALDVKTGKVCYYAYITDRQKFALAKHNGVCFTKRFNVNTNNPETKSILRSRLVKTWLLGHLDAMKKLHLPVFHAAIEGYSYGSNSKSAYQIGGLIEGIKSLLYNRKIYIRIYSPRTIQSWANVNIADHKREMIVSAIKAGYKAVDDSHLLEVKQTAKGEQRIDCPASDLSDAFWLAQMLRTELLLRSGDMDIKNDLTDKQRRLLLSTTPTRKVNYLDFDFIGEFHEQIF